MAFAVSTARAWPLSSVDHGPAHPNSPANTYCQTRPVTTMTASLLTTRWGRVPSVRRMCYPARAWPIKLLACAVPSFPCPRSHATNIGFLGRWGTYACPQCLSSDIVPIRSWTRTLRPPGIRRRHLPCHTMPSLHAALLRTTPSLNQVLKACSSTVPTGTRRRSATVHRRMSSR